jgi:hypothetical protein
MHPAVAVRSGRKPSRKNPGPFQAQTRRFWLKKGQILELFVADKFIGVIYNSFIYKELLGLEGRKRRNF